MSSYDRGRSSSPRERYARERRPTPTSDRYDRRDRLFEERERDRDYRDRKRLGSRSPDPYGDRRMKRRRSLSPMRDRYDTRDRFSSGRTYDYRDHHYGHPEGRGYSSQLGYSSRGGMENPDSLPYQVSFRYFQEYTRHTRPEIADDPDRLQDLWKRYRTERLRKSYVQFFDEHKSQAWFKEKYDPKDAENRKMVKSKGREGKMEAFLESLKNGEFDDISFSHVDKPSANGDPTRTNEDRPMDENNLDESVQEEVPSGDASKPTTDEEKPKSDLPAKDEALADTELKQEQVTGDESDNDATKGDVDMTGDVKGDGDQGDPGKKDDVIIVPGSEHQLFIKSIAPDLARADLEAHCSQVPNFDYLALSEPHSAKKFHRVGWVSFKPDTNMTEPLERLCESRINNFTLHMIQANKPSLQKLRLVPSIMATTDRIEKDLEQIRKLVNVFEKELGDVRGSQAIEAKRQQILDALPEKMTVDETADCVAPEASPSEDVNRKTLDFYLHYVRVVFNTCYYCVCVADFQEELLRRCARHERKSLPLELNGPAADEKDRNAAKKRNPKQGDVGWARVLDEKLQLLLARDAIDPRDYGADSYDEELHRLCIPHIRHEEEGKFRCKACSKLFKALNFIEKHIANKHPEVVGEVLEELNYFNNYVLDPGHIAPQPPQQDPPPHMNGMQPGMPPAMFNPTAAAAMFNFNPYMAGFPNFNFAPGGNPMGFNFQFPNMYTAASMDPVSGAVGARRLSDRIGDKLADDDRGPPRASGTGAKRHNISLPPPAGAKLDPRAKDRSMSYHDLDVAPAGSGGDIVLPY